MYIKNKNTPPIRMQAIRIPEVQVIDENTHISRRKVIKDYIYTPEFRMIRA